MAKIEELKEALYGKKNKDDEKSETTTSPNILSEEIVRKVLERYQESGEYIPEEDVEPSINLEETLAIKTLQVEAVPLEKHPSPLIRFLGNMYKKLKGVVDSIASRLVNSSVMKKIDLELYSANIKLTAVQLVSLSLTAALISSILVLVFVPIFTRNLTGVISAPLLALATFFIVFFYGLTYPSRVARARGREIEKKLPFALRHLAVVIRSGMSLFKAMESIASADYGVLSEEFRRTIREISEGKTTEEALESLAIRSHSRGMKRAINQIMRALRIGGNISDAIRRIAEDVAFEQRNRVREFSEMLNMVGVVFMFVGVVFPALMAILNGIGNAPLGMNLLSAFAMPKETLITVYLITIPLLMIFIILFVKRADPLGGEV